MRNNNNWWSSTNNKCKLIKWVFKTKWTQTSNSKCSRKWRCNNSNNMQDKKISKSIILILSRLMSLWCPIISRLKSECRIIR
jgi:hypothetical protein